MTCYIIPGNPVPQARARGSSTHFWDPSKQQKLNIKLILEQQHNNLPLFEGKPLHMEVDFYLPIPTTSKKRTDALKGTYHHYKPDIDNLLKLILDVARGLIYHDDSMIASLTSRKRYDENPRTEFTIRVL